MRRSLAIGIVVVIIIIAVAAAAVLASMPQNNNPSGSSGQNMGSSSKNATVSINNFAFNPTPLTVSVGTTVTWTNNQDTTHTVSSDQGSAESFDSGNLAPGATFAHTFNSPGTFDYHCNIHPSMHGQIIVTSGSTQQSGTNQSNPAPGY